MPEDDKTGEGAADLTGVQAGAADLQQAGDISDAAGQDTSNAQVDAFKAKAEDEVAKRQTAEAEVQRLRDEILVKQANTQPSAVPQDVFAQAGLDDFDNPTVEQIRQQQNQQTGQVLATVNFQNFIATNPDYFSIVGATDGNGRFVSAEPLKELIKDNPHLSGLNNPAVAYKLVKQHMELKELRAKETANTEHQHELDIANKVDPLSPVAAGGGGATPVENPTDAQVDEQWERIEAGDFG